MQVSEELRSANLSGSVPLPIWIGSAVRKNRRLKSRTCTAPAASMHRRLSRARAQLCLTNNGAITRGQVCWTARCGRRFRRPVAVDSIISVGNHASECTWLGGSTCRSCSEAPHSTAPDAMLHTLALPSPPVVPAVVAVARMRTKRWRYRRTIAAHSISPATAQSNQPSSTVGASSHSTSKALLAASCCKGSIKGT